MSRARFPRSLRLARVVTLALLSAAALASVGLAGVGLLVERRESWVVLGVVGLLTLLAALAGAVWLLHLLARLDATEERLRYARNVHDEVGHNLVVIALKAELAARLAPIDAERSAHEAADVQRLAGSALAEVRRPLHGTARPAPS